MRGAPGPAADSVERWLGVRRLLSGNRQLLSEVAARLYPAARRVESGPFLCRDDWLPGRPLALDEVALRWREDAAAPVVDGTGPGSAHVRPAGPGGGRYATYAAAIADLDRPALLEDRACYRLLDVGLAAGAPGSPGMAFGRTGYFDGVNLGHAVAHELAAAWQASPAALGLADLPLRAAAGDPCALERRPALSAVITLTLRRAPGGEASFVLHWRDPARVNHAGGMYQVMPAGIFQPLHDTPAAWRGDFSLWRCMVREFSEEFLGTSEEYATRDGALDYEGWPFYRKLSAARQDGGVTVWCLGAGTDPLTLATDILTVAVFDGDVFDAVFADMVAVNAEGAVVSEGGSVGVPFTADTVARLTGGSEPMQPAGAALLRLAWRHRRLLLG